MRKKAGWAQRGKLDQVAVVPALQCRQQAWARWQLLFFSAQPTPACILRGNTAAVQSRLGSQGLGATETQAS